MGNLYRGTDNSMRYQDPNPHTNRNWYGENKKHQGVYKKQKQSMFYEVIHWFEAWVLIFLIAGISLFVYLSLG